LKIEKVMNDEGEEEGEEQEEGQGEGEEQEEGEG